MVVEAATGDIGLDMGLPSIYALHVCWNFFSWRPEPLPLPEPTEEKWWTKGACGQESAKLLVIRPVVCLAVGAAIPGEEALAALGEMSSEHLSPSVDPARSTALIFTFCLIQAHAVAHSAHANHLVALAAYLHRWQAWTHRAPIAYHLCWVPTPRARWCPGQWTRDIRVIVALVELSGCGRSGHTRDAATLAFKVRAALALGLPFLLRRTCAFFFCHILGARLPHRVAHHVHELLRQRDDSFLRPPWHDSATAGPVVALSRPGVGSRLPRSIARHDQGATDRARACGQWTALCLATSKNGCTCTPLSLSRPLSLSGISLCLSLMCGRSTCRCIVEH